MTKRSYAPVANWKQRHRSGITMSQKMMCTLQTLREAKANGMLFIPLPDTHLKTIHHMLEQDWIIDGFREGEGRYQITKRGEKVLKLFECPPRRFDQVCPDCLEHKRAVRSNGNLMPYCLECTRKQGRRQYALKGHQYIDNRLCPTCHERPRYKYPSGFQIAYCKECRNSQRAEEKRRKNARLIEQLQSDTPPLCIRCKEVPRYLANQSVYDYCYSCYREMQNTYNRRANRTLKETV